MHLQKVMAIKTLLEFSRQPIEEVEVSLASDFMCNYVSTDVTTSFGYDYILLQGATGQVATIGMVALSYVQKYFDRVSLASEFMYNYVFRDVTASFCQKYILRQVYHKKKGYKFVFGLTVGE